MSLFAGVAVAPGVASYVINLSWLNEYVMKYKKLLFKVFFLFYLLDYKIVLSD